jgi:hypothetical protein
MAMNAVAAAGYRCHRPARRCAVATMRGDERRRWRSSLLSAYKGSYERRAIDAVQ